MRPLARNTDPMTSHQAAEDAAKSGRVVSHIDRIVSAIKEHPGKTSAELAQITGLERHEAARRTSDAHALAMVVKGRARKCSLSNRNAMTWWPV